MLLSSQSCQRGVLVAALQPEAMTVPCSRRRGVLEVGWSELKEVLLPIDLVLVFAIGERVGC